MVSIAQAVFESGPKDSVVMVDVYNAVTPEVRNNLTSKLSAFGNSLTDSFSSATKTVKELGATITNGRMNVEQAAQRIRAALNGSRGDITNLATGLQNAIFSGLTGAAPGTNYIQEASSLYDQVSIVVGQGKHLVNSDKKSVSAILNFVSDLTNQPVFKTLDLGAEAALLGGLLGEVSSWGVPSLVDTMMEGKDQEFKYAIYSRNSESVLRNSSAAMIEHYVNQGLASALTSNQPGFGNDFLAQYTFPDGTTPDKYPVLHAQLVKIMDDLKPNWLRIQRGEVITNNNGQTVITPKMVPNLGALTRASSDAKTLLASDATTRTQVLISSNFPRIDLIQLAKRNYPLIGIR